MPADTKPPGKSREFDARLLAQLACPVCFGALRMERAGERIVCEGCGRGYPVIDGIPVLIAERAALT